MRPKRFISVLEKVSSIPPKGSVHSDVSMVKLEAGLIGLCECFVSPYGLVEGTGGNWPEVWMQVPLRAYPYGFV